MPDNITADREILHRPATKFEPPTIKQRGQTSFAVATAQHEAQAMAEGAREGRTACTCCKDPRGIRWSGDGSRSSGGCISCRDVRWASQ